MLDNTNRAEAVFNAWEDRDFHSLVENMVEDVVVNAPGQVVVEGRAGVSEWYASWATACPDAVAGARCVGASSSTAVMEGVYSGTNTGQFGPMPPTGKSVSLPWVNVYTFNSSGQITKVNAYFDQTTLLAQLGDQQPLA